MQPLARSLRPPPLLALLCGVAACEGPALDAPLAAPTAAGPARLHRLTVAQYQAAARDLLGVVQAPADLPADSPLHGYSSVGSSEVTIAPRDLELYEGAALELAGQVFNDAKARLALVGCDPAAPPGGDDCARAFLERFAARAYRRPLTGAGTDDDEALPLLELTRRVGTALGSPWEGLRYAVAAVLQSPHFLFRVELGEDDPNLPGRRRYSTHEMASRLSFLLTGGPPDDELRDAAERGALTETGPLAAQAERLLAAPAARAAVSAFFGEYLNLSRLATLSKDRALFPQVTPPLLAAMSHEVLRDVEDVVFTRRADVRELWTGDRTYVNAGLAALYGLPPPDKPEADGFAAVTLPAQSRRGGLLGTAALLALNANATVTSPTHRGKFVRAQLLCQDIPPPPPGVTTSLEPPNGTPTTLRQRLEKHRESPACRGCHERMDPIGLGLENFDAIGAFRDKESGLAVDARGDLDGAPFIGAGDLGALVAMQPTLAPCLARQIYRHGTGHTEGEAQAPLINELSTALSGSGYRLTDLLKALILSDGFRAVGPEEG